MTATLVLTIAVAVISPAVTFGQAPLSPSATLTLDEALARAMQANRTIIAARAAAPVATAAVDVAGERPNPELSFEASKETPKQSISGSFPLELGGKRQRRIDLAKAGVAAQEAELQWVIAEVRAEVRRAYFELVAATARAELAGDIRGVAERVRDTAQARVQAGDAPRLELVQMELALAGADNDLAGARGDIVAARAELNVLIGNPADAPLSLGDALTSGAPPPLAAALAQANTANAELAVIDRRIAEQSARRNLAKAMRTPDLTAGVSFTYKAEPEFSYGWRAGAGITLPVFTTHAAGVLFEDAELTRLRAEREAVAARMAGAVTAAVVHAQVTGAQVDRFQRDILPRAAEVERMAQDAYSSGQTGLVALLQTLQATRDIRRRSLETALEFQRALADLDRAIGAAIK